MYHTHAVNHRTYTTPLLLMDLTKLYTKLADNDKTKWYAKQRIGYYRNKLQELRDEYPQSNEIRKPEIRREADTIKRYIKTLE